MHSPTLSLSIDPALADSRWRAEVQPQVSGTHLPTYNIIGAKPRPKSITDQASETPSSRNDIFTSNSSSLWSSTGTLSSRRKKSNRKLATTPVTRENLAYMSMMSCAREEDLDAPIKTLTSTPVPLATVTKRPISCDMSTSVSSSGSASDLPSITEEDEIQPVHD